MSGTTVAMPQTLGNIMQSDEIADRSNPSAKNPSTVLDYTRTGPLPDR